MQLYKVLKLNMETYFDFFVTTFLYQKLIKQIKILTAIFYILKLSNLFFA